MPPVVRGSLARAWPACPWRVAGLIGVLLGLVAVVPPAPSSEVPWRDRLAGHPRARLPLAVSVPVAGGTGGAAIERAVADWNALATEALGVPAFRWASGPEHADVVLRMVAGTGAKLMGVTHLEVLGDGAIVLPVHVDIVEPARRGGTTAEVVLYQVAAHELGHVLGLPHRNEAGSLMCCDPGALDLKDPATLAVYVQARREPDIRSVERQLVEHYRRLWGDALDGGVGPPPPAPR